MSYGRLDDGWHEDPRVLEAGLAAAGLYASMTCYVARHLLDGVIPRRVVGRMLEGGDTDPLDALLRVGLLTETADAYSIPDYFDNGNETREVVLENRARAKERKAEWRRRKQAERRARTDAGS